MTTKRELKERLRLAYDLETWYRGTLDKQAKAHDVLLRDYGRLLLEFSALSKMLNEKAEEPDRDASEPDRDVGPPQW